MSILDKKSIQIIAQSHEINQLDEDLAQAIASEAEFRIREIIQEGLKFMKHSKRKVLTCRDLGSAFKQLNIDRPYGYPSSSSIKYTHLPGTDDLWILQDKSVDLKQALSEKFPAIPVEPALHLHWLAIEGVKPFLSENQLESIFEDLNRKTHEEGEEESMEHEQEDKAKTKIVPAVRHVLSKEARVYFDKLAIYIRNDFSELAVDKKRTKMQEYHQVLVSLKSTPSITQLCPYILSFIVNEQFNRKYEDLHLNYRVIAFLGALVSNKYVNLEPYLHQALPIVMSCIVNSKLSAEPSDNHWLLREQAGSVLAKICYLYDDEGKRIRSKICNQLKAAISDPSKSFMTQYGAIQALTFFGPMQYENYILPCLKAYLESDKVQGHLINPTLESVQAQRCIHALQFASCEYMRYCFKTTINQPEKGRDVLKTYTYLQEIFGDSILARSGFDALLYRRLNDIQAYDSRGGMNQTPLTNFI